MWGPLAFVFLYLIGLVGLCAYVAHLLEPSAEAIRIELEKEEDER